MTCMNEMNEMNLDGVEMKETTITMEVRGAALRSNSAALS